MIVTACFPPGERYLPTEIQGQARKGFVIDMVHTVLTVLQVIMGVALVVIVVMQSGKSSGLGVISGAADTFLSKNKARGLDAKLAKYTKWVAIVFMALTLSLSLV